MKSIEHIYKIGKGPSSSHTIGPEKATLVFKEKYPEADTYRVYLYGSLSKTGRGHGTDRVVVDSFAPSSCQVIFVKEEDTPEGVQHPNTMDFEALSNDEVIGKMRAISIGGGDVRFEGQEVAELPEIYPENTFAEIAEFCKFRKLDLAEYVEFNEGQEIWDYLAVVWETMKQSIAEGLEADGILPGGLQIQRKAKLLYNQNSMDELPQVRECRILASYAFAVSEQNADNGIIVTAPTCGSCGIIPATLKYMQEQNGYSNQEILKALGVAGLFGNLIKTNASISGAECGCQAEIGAACAMAAAALSYLLGGDANQIQQAAEIALEHHLGLTCDPICGLVQVPCIERNAVAVRRAFDAANLATFLGDTQQISFDIVVRTMYETGASMNARFRETAEGGLAKMFEKRR